MAVVVVLVLTLSGCTGKSTGTVGVAVTDKPTEDYSSVMVTFSRAAIHKSGDNESGGWMDIANTTRTVDLLALHANGTAEALGFAKVEAGHYQQVRVYVDRVEATKKSDGSEVVMTVPSGVLRTTKSFEVKAGGNTTLTLELDLDRSINCNGDSCRFSPVLGKVEATEK
jgi:uncharacterized protein DUF4382